MMSVEEEQGMNAQIDQHIAEERAFFADPTNLGRLQPHEILEGAEPIKVVTVMTEGGSVVDIESPGKDASKEAWREFWRVTHQIHRPDQTWIDGTWTTNESGRRYNGRLRQELQKTDWAEYEPTKAPPQL